MPPDNPYTTPTEAPGVLENTTRMGFGQIARSVFSIWERLRVLYIAILVVATIFGITLADPFPLGLFEFWITLFGGAIVANIAFFAGPIFETYAAWLGFPTRWIRVSLFVVGSVAASILAVSTISTL